MTSTNSTKTPVSASDSEQEPAKRAAVTELYSIQWRGRAANTGRLYRADVVEAEDGFRPTGKGDGYFTQLNYNKDFIPRGELGERVFRSKEEAIQNQRTKLDKKLADLQREAKRVATRLEALDNLPKRG